MLESEKHLGLCPEDQIRILLPANLIPDTSIVSKRSGESTFTLKHSLRVYPETKGEKVLTIEGCFLVGQRGDVNQVSDKTLLHWHVTAEDFVDTMQQSWEGPPQ